MSKKDLLYNLNMQNEPRVVLLTNKMEPANYDENMNGDESYLLVVFQTPIQFSYDGVTYFTAPANTAIIYEPFKGKFYRSNGSIVLNSFMNVYNYNDYFKSLNIPFNTLLSLTEEEQEKIVFEMDRLSYIINTPYAQSLISEIPHYLEKILSLIQKISEKQDDVSDSKGMMTSFIKVRSLMYKDPVNFTVKTMASTINYSETYFGIKYKEFFGISPCQDRKNKIVELIKQYLETTDYSLDTISDFCNIKSTPHLINLFKSVTNMTPHQYRKKSKKI